MRNWSQSLRWWLAIVGTATIVIGAAYTMAQQSTRLGAKDLPLQTAQSIKYQLNSGASPQDAVPQIKTDLSSDATTFAIITNSQQDVLASSATLDGRTPVPPSGTFDFTKAHGNDTFTWQPASGVRLVTQMLSYKADSSEGFIITGQSLKPAEDRISTYGDLAFASWLAAIAWTSIILLVMRPHTQPQTVPSSTSSGPAPKSAAKNRK